MEEYITVSAKNLDDAITEALIQLGVTSDRLDYIVVEKGSAGFLGIGMKQAVIKARRKVEVKPIEESVKEEPVKEEPVKEIKKEETSVKPSKEWKEKKKKPERKQEKSVKPARQEKAEPVAEAAEPVKEEEISEKKEPELAKVEQQTIETCEKFIYDVLKAMDMTDVKVTSTIDEEGALSIDMEGSNMGILIGKRGQTLDSLQYLTNRVANKMQDGYVRVKLDTEDYRRRRKETLENLAKNIAAKVKRTRRTVSLEPMNPYERRIIHSALQADPSVSTHSEGEEPYRRVVVTLVRNRNNR
ncbi:MAG: RNA-binding cell elongation regulator Jag/EloR [Dorea sp.]|nr:RNA-binding cell elongation regulator Jag/EloR [Dorea sp.]